MSVRDNIEAGKYDAIETNFQRAPDKNAFFTQIAQSGGGIMDADTKYKALRNEEVKARREAAQKAIQQMEDDYVEENPDLNDWQVRKAFQFAWEEGHSGGYSEVDNYMSRVLDILRP